MRTRYCFALLAFTISVIAIGCDSFSNKENKINIRYYVDSSADEMAVTYTKSNGRMSDQKVVDVPWRKDVKTSYSGDIFFTVQFIEGNYISGDQATARILVDGSECASNRFGPPAFQIGCTFDNEE